MQPAKFLKLTVSVCAALCTSRSETPRSLRVSLSRGVTHIPLTFGPDVFSREFDHDDNVVRARDAKVFTVNLQLTPEAARTPEAALRSDIFTSHVLIEPELDRVPEPGKPEHRSAGSTSVMLCDLAVAPASGTVAPSVGSAAVAVGARAGETSSVVAVSSAPPAQSDQLGLVLVYADGTGAAVAQPKAKVWMRVSDVQVVTYAADGRTIVTRALLQVNESVMQSALLKREEEERAQHTVNAYISGCQYMYQRLRPTWEAVRHIHCLSYRFGSSALPSVFYSMPSDYPVVSPAYFLNALRIVLRRERVSEAEFLGLADGSRLAADIAVQVATAYAWYCTYESDGSDVRQVQRMLRRGGIGGAYHQPLYGDGHHMHPLFDPRADIDLDDLFDVRQPLKHVPTEDFNVALRNKADDCEGTSELNMQMVMAITYYMAAPRDPLLRKLRAVLSLYVPMLVLMGVSSGDVGGDYKLLAARRGSIGAHMSLALVAKHAYYGMHVRVNRERTLVPSPDERVLVDESRRCTETVLFAEGTGPLIPSRRPLDRRVHMLLPEAMVAAAACNAHDKQQQQQQQQQTWAPSSDAVGADANNDGGSAAVGDAQLNAQLFGVSVRFMSDQEVQQHSGGATHTNIQTRAGASAAAAPVQSGIEFVSNSGIQQRAMWDQPIGCFPFRAQTEAASTHELLRNETITRNSLFATTIVRAAFPDALGHVPRMYWFTDSPGLRNSFYFTAQSVYTPQLMHMGIPRGASAVVRVGTSAEGKPEYTYGVPIHEFIANAPTVGMACEPELDMAEIDASKLLMQRAPPAPPVFAPPPALPTQRAVDDGWLMKTHPTMLQDAAADVVTAEKHEERTRVLADIAAVADNAAVTSMLKHIYAASPRVPGTGVCVLEPCPLSADAVAAVYAANAGTAAAAVRVLALPADRRAAARELADATLAAHRGVVFRNAPALPTTATYLMRYAMVDDDVRMDALRKAAVQSVRLNTARGVVMLDPAGMEWDDEHLAPDHGGIRLRLRYFTTLLVK